MWSDLPQEKKKRRDVQGDLFSRPELDEARLPAGPGKADDSRSGRPDDEPPTRPPKAGHDSRPDPRRRPSDQPLLPFGRPPSPHRAPAGDGATRGQVPAPRPLAPTPARREP